LDVQGFGLFERVASISPPLLQTDLWIPPPVLAAPQVEAAVVVVEAVEAAEVGVVSPPAAEVGVAAEAERGAAGGEMLAAVAMENLILLFVPRSRVPATRKWAWIDRSLSSFTSTFEWHNGLGIDW
jgi:hypothetical protein